MFFPLEEKNLLNPRACFSGVGAEEDEEELDLVGLCFGCLELTGDLKKLPPSLSEALHGDSAPTTGVIAEAAVSISDRSRSRRLVPLLDGSSSINSSPL